MSLPPSYSMYSMYSMRSILLALVLCVGCSDDSHTSAASRSPAKTAPVSPTSSAARLQAPTADGKLSCEQRTAWLEQELQAAAKSEPAALSPQLGVSLAPLTQGQPVVGTGEVVAISAKNQVTYQGRPMGTGADAAGRLRQRIEIEKRRGAAPSGKAKPAAPVYFMADQHASAKLVVDLVGALPAGTEARLALLDPTVKRAPVPHLDHPPVAAIQRVAQSTQDAAERALLFAQHMERASLGCDPVLKVFAGVARVDAGDKAAVIADALPAALRSCDCGVADLELFEYILVSVMRVHNPYRWLPAAFSPGAKTPLRLAPGATVAQLAAALSAMSAAQLAAPLRVSFAR